jgi:biotin synthase
VMPKVRVRLSAGRSQLTREAQVLYFLAGANSIFYGDSLLTTGNPEEDCDRQLLRDIGVQEGGNLRTQDEKSINFSHQQFGSTC